MDGWKTILSFAMASWRVRSVRFREGRWWKHFSKCLSLLGESWGWKHQLDDFDGCYHYKDPYRYDYIFDDHQIGWVNYATYDQIYEFTLASWRLLLVVNGARLQTNSKYQQSKHWMTWVYQIHSILIWVFTNLCHIVDGSESLQQVRLVVFELRQVWIAPLTWDWREISHWSGKGTSKFLGDKLYPPWN